MTYKLQTQFSQLQNGQNAKFQCLSDAEFLEFSKNGLTFYHNPFLLGVIVKKQWAHFFWETIYTIGKGIVLSPELFHLIHKKVQ